MEKLVLFPLNDDTEVVINNLQAINQYEIVAVSSYYEDKKRIEQLQKNTSFYCSTDFESCLAKGDAVVFAENTRDYSYDGYKERVEKAQKFKKKVYISAALLEKIGVDIREDNFYILQEKETSEDLGDIRIKEIDLPIISVMGLGKDCDKFNLQVKIKLMAEKKGYHVLSISSNILGKFLGMEMLPGFLYSKNVSFPEKVKAFNSWIYQLQKQRQPDLIILGCPGGISEFEEFETNFYGEIPLVISNSIVIDAGIVTLYANWEQDADSAKMLSDFCRLKYNTMVNDYVISMQYFKTDYEWKKIRYYKLTERNNTDNKMKNMLGYRISCIEDDLGIEEQLQFILEKFENNLHVI